MPITLKDRVDAIERKVDELAAALRQSGHGKDWRRTFGMSANDAGFEEMIRLGRAARLAINKKSLRSAGS